MPDASGHKTYRDVVSYDEIDRDLTFHPVDNPSPSSLTPGQIASFNERGYLSPLPAMGADEIADLRSYFDDLLERALAEGKDSYSLSTAHRRFGRVYDLIYDRRFVDPVVDLLGEDVVGWGSHFFCKMPGDGKRVSWHQDASYWPMTPARTVTVWLAIDDADVENACMRFLPGTHKHGHLTYRLSEDDEANVLNQTVDDVERFGDPVDVELKAGDMSIHSDLLLHGSEPNNSTRRRCGLTLRYCAAEVRAYLDWHEKGNIVNGSDPTHHWTNGPRPNEE